jgi:hypothetical protein
VTEREAPGASGSHTPDPAGSTPPATNPGGNGYVKLDHVIAVVRLATDPIAAQITDLRSDIVAWRKADQEVVARLRGDFELCRANSQAYRAAEAREEARREGQWSALWALVRFVRSEWRTIGLLVGWAATVGVALGWRA